MRSATVHIRVESTAAEAIQALLPDLASHISGKTVVMPSTLERDDLVAEAVSESIGADADVKTIVPVRGAAAHRAFLTPGVLGTWRDVPIRAESSLLTSVLMPNELVNAQHRLIVVDVVEVARRGPFVLDVPARFAHPRHRVRLVSDVNRNQLVAEVASAIRIDLAIVSLSLPHGALVAMTTDLIAAELVALALSERCMGSARSFTGPWEDPVVQRATELHMGVLLPMYIKLQGFGTRRHEPWADQLIEHIRRRLGLPGTPSMSS